MMKRTVILSGCFLVYLLFCWGVHTARVNLYTGTRTFYSGNIVNILGFKQFKDGDFDFCVLGPMKSKKVEEYLIHVDTSPPPQPEWSEYKPFISADGTKWFYPQAEDIGKGCDPEIKKMKDNAVSLDKSNGRIIAIKKPGQGVTNIVVKSITDYHETDRQKMLSKFLDVAEVFSAPGELIIGIGSIMIYGFPG